MDSVTALLADAQNNSIIWSLLSVFTIGSTFFGIYTWKKGREKRRISYCKKTNQVIYGGKKLIESLNITYDGVVVDALSISRIMIWNSGNRVLSVSDFASADRLSIKACENERLLDCQLIDESESNNRFELSSDGKTLNISFEFIDPNQGSVIQVVHSGGGDSIRLCGRIKGGSIQEWNPWNPSPNLIPLLMFGSRTVSRTEMRKILAVVCALLTTILVIATCVLIFSEIFLIDIEQNLKNIMYNTMSPNERNVIKILMFVCLVLYCTAFSMCSIQLVRRAFFLGSPRELKKMFEYEDSVS